MEGLGVDDDAVEVEDDGVGGVGVVGVEGHGVTVPAGWGWVR